MGRRKNSYWASMSAQTSVEGVTATTSGHGREPFSRRVSSAPNSVITGAGHTSCNATATTTNTKSQRRLLGVVVKTEPGTTPPRKDGPRRSSEGMKAKAQYKAALKIKIRLQDKTVLSLNEKKQLAWAEKKIEEGRLHFAKLSNMASTGGFANKVEEILIKKRQGSVESAAKDGSVSKRKRGPMDEEPPPPPPIVRKPERKSETKISEVSKRHLIVALIDRSDENGQMTEARWKTVNARLVKSLFARMEEDPKAPMPTFDGAGWLNGVKILKCMDLPTLKWLTQTVCQLEALWEGAKLEVVDRKFIPSIPKAKVLFPIAIQRDHALKLLQRQNPDVPTADWKILHLESPLPNEGGQCAILQINKKAENILYPRYGKMAWGMGSVYLRLKKRHPGDMDAHTLLAGEVEKDLGLETTLTLIESEEDDDVTILVNTSGRDEHSIYYPECAAAHPP